MGNVKDDSQSHKGWNVKLSRLEREGKGQWTDGGKIIIEIEQRNIGWKTEDRSK